MHVSDPLCSGFNESSAVRAERFIESKGDSLTWTSLTTTDLIALDLLLPCKVIAAEEDVGLSTHSVDKSEVVRKIVGDSQL